ncbi:hypothetical protein LPJ70_001818 [Coemansia sp. RSA 2708]|nr:hypothetical protein LPJ70_003841 [Coemansia sp. RSA 2708]KAJ1846878.1 hypothetical protein LPJ70_001818 [Coemansia sp. RSA 2708]KAJ2322067.1 hypothetical protein IWW51_004286 [Coemansia sp. RSA 2702]
MKFVAFVAFLIGAITGSAQPASTEAAQICTKACQAAPAEQRETCMRVCTQFAEQSAGFNAAASPSPSKGTANLPTVSVKSAESMGSSASAVSSGSAKGKSRGEDNDEDHESVEKSASASQMVSGAAQTRVGGAVAAIAALAAFI